MLLRRRILLVFLQAGLFHSLVANVHLKFYNAGNRAQRQIHSQFPVNKVAEQNQQQQQDTDQDWQPLLQYQWMDFKASPNRRIDPFLKKQRGRNTSNDHQTQQEEQGNYMNNLSFKRFPISDYAFPQNSDTFESFKRDIEEKSMKNGKNMFPNNIPKPNYFPENNFRRADYFQRNLKSPVPLAFQALSNHSNDNRNHNFINKNNNGSLNLIFNKGKVERNVSKNLFDIAKGYSTTKARLKLEQNHTVNRSDYHLSKGNSKSLGNHKRIDESHNENDVMKIMERKVEKEYFVPLERFLNNFQNIYEIASNFISYNDDNDDGDDDDHDNDKGVRGNDLSYLMNNTKLMTTVQGRSDPQLIQQIILPSSESLLIPSATSSLGSERALDKPMSPSLSNFIGTGRKKIKKIKKKFKKMLLPLLIAYKLKFLTLIPLLIGGLTLLVGTTGLAGFFFALFTAVMSMKSTGGSSKSIIVKK